MDLHWKVKVWLQLFLVSLSEAADTLRICYFSGGSIYRDDHSLKPKDIDPFLCTHLVYASAVLTEDGKSVTLPDGYDDFQQYKELTDLMKINENLKVMLSIGGWEAGSKGWTNLVSSRTNMNEFALEVIRYLRMHNFDGLDLNWEYPATRGSPPQDKYNFAELLEVLHHYFEIEEEPDNKENLVLSVCVDPSQEMIDRSYDLKRMSRAVDWINLKLYDFYGHWDDPIRAYPHSALTGENGLKNVNSLLKNWVKLGVPKYKLVLGIPLFGRSFRLQDKNFTAPGSLAVGPGSDNGEGYPIRNLCHLLMHGGLTENMYARVPYVVHGDEWISHDNPASVMEKAELVFKNNLRGIFVWTIDMDDYSGACGTKHPMMFAILHGLHAYRDYMVERNEAMLYLAKQNRVEQRRLEKGALEKLKAGHTLGQLMGTNMTGATGKEGFYW